MIHNCPSGTQPHIHLIIIEYSRRTFLLCNSLACLSVAGAFAGAWSPLRLFEARLEIFSLGSRSLVKITHRE
jgi:hypothetical protein